MDNRQYVKEVADMNDDFAKWYTDVVVKTELVDYGPVKGTMVIRPYGYAIWENIQAEMNARFKAVGVKNAYFPMLIPESYLKREADRVGIESIRLQRYTSNPSGYTDCLMLKSKGRETDTSI